MKGKMLPGSKHKESLLEHMPITVVKSRLGLGAACSPQIRLGVTALYWQTLLRLSWTELQVPGFLMRVGVGMVEQAFGVRKTGPSILLCHMTARSNSFWSCCVRI